jgi:hypothetical protein
MINPHCGSFLKCRTCSRGVRKEATRERKERAMEVTPSASYRNK